MDILTLRQKLAKHLPPAALAEIGRAYEYSNNAHRGQKRAGGKPYIVHPLAVADILADWRFDSPSIVAALLHDVVEDTPITLQQLEAEFGGDVARLVDGLSKIERLQGVDRAARDAENFRKLLLASAADWRALFIKLADRLHNMRTLAAIANPAKRRETAEQTLAIFAPIAARLGARSVQDELQNLAFRHIRPYRFRILTKALKKSMAQTRAAAEAAQERLRAGLRENKIGFRMEKREKNLFSIYQKMEREGLSFANVEDILGLRLIVETRQICYLALGVAHSLFLPRMERFKDFIAIPKSNGYQSLHTRLVAKSGVKLDLQIRTAAMHEVAENGLAAHWKYKQGDGELSKTQAEALRLLSSLVRLHDENTEAADFMGHVKVDLSPKEMYVLTPAGEVVRLPRGATALDMAYAIHTQLGERAEKAIINGRAAPLAMRLENGDQVDIVSNPNVTPQPHWLHYAKTARARSRIRQTLKAGAGKEAEALGKNLLANAVRKATDGKAELDDVDEAQWEKWRSANNLKDRAALYRAITTGELLPDIVAHELLKKRVKQTGGGALQPLSIAGAGRAATHLSPCCFPLPFEPIVGFLRKEKGLIIHAARCPTALAAKRGSEKWIETRWHEDANKRLHQAACRLECHNRPGLVTTVAAAVGERNINIVSFNLEGGAMERDSLSFEMILEVRELKEFEGVISALRKLDDVFLAERQTRPGAKI